MQYQRFGWRTLWVWARTTHLSSGISRNPRIRNMEGPKLKKRSACSTHELLQETKQLAHAVHNLPCPPEEQPRTWPVLPVSIGVELPRMDTELREHLLFKLGDPAWEAKPAASRLAWTVGLPEKEEKGIEDDMTKLTAPFKRHGQAAAQGLGPITNDMRVRLPVYVKRGNHVLRDELDLHMGSLGGVGNSMAAAVQSYAGQVCRDLGLSSAWFTSLLRHVGTLFSEVNEDIKATGTSELLVTHGADGRLRAKPSDLPRLEEVNPELEAVERDRVKRREEKLIARQKQKKEAQAKAQAEAQARSQEGHGSAPPGQAQQQGPGVVKPEGGAQQQGTPHHAGHGGVHAVQGQQQRAGLHGAGNHGQGPVGLGPAGLGPAGLGPAGLGLAGQQHNMSGGGAT